MIFNDYVVIGLYGDPLPLEYLMEVPIKEREKRLLKASVFVRRHKKLSLFFK